MIEQQSQNKHFQIKPGDNIGLYTAIQFISKCSNGQVWKVQQCISYQVYAIKIYFKSQLKSNEKQKTNMKYLQYEYNILKDCKSDYIIKFIQRVQTQNIIGFVMEYCNQNTLAEYIAQNEISEQIAIVILKQILSGLMYIHHKKILHRDLKPSNIFKVRNKFKIADFGYSKILQQDKNLIANTLVGTIGYIAPQVISKSYTFQADVWSIGIIYYEMLFKSFPFKSIQILKKNEPEILEIYRTTNIKQQIQKLNVSISIQSQTFILQTLKYDPNQRISFKKLLDQAVIKNKQSIILSQILFQMNPDIEKPEQNNEEQKKYESIINQSISRIRENIFNNSSNLVQNKILNESNIRAQSLIEVSSKKKKNNIAEKFFKIFNNQKNKLAFLVKFVIRSENTKTKQEINKSRKLLELRLMISHRALRKAQYLNQLLLKLKVGDQNQNQHPLSAFQKRTQKQILLEIMKNIINKCNKYRTHIKENLDQVKSEWTKKFKDFFLKYFDSDFVKKQAILENDKLNEAEQTLFIKQILHNLKYKFKKLTPNQGSFQFIFVLKHYQLMAADVQLNFDFTQEECEKKYEQLKQHIKLTDRLIEQISKKYKNDTFQSKIQFLLNDIP